MGGFVLSGNRTAAKIGREKDKSYHRKKPTSWQGKGRPSSRTKETIRVPKSAHGNRISSATSRHDKNAGKRDSAGPVMQRTNRERWGRDSARKRETKRKGNCAVNKLTSSDRGSGCCGLASLRIRGKGLTWITPQRAADSGNVTPPFTFSLAGPDNPTRPAGPPAPKKAGGRMRSRGAKQAATPVSHRTTKKGIETGPPHYPGLYVKYLQCD